MSATLDIRSHIARALRDARSLKGESIVYVRRGGNRIDITDAVYGSSDAVTGGSGVLVAAHSVDVLIEVAQMVDGQPFEPSRDDTIERTIDTVRHHYKVLPFGGGRNAAVWRFSDSGHTQFRIHTQHFKQEPVS